MTTGTAERIQSLLDSVRSRLSPDGYADVSEYLRAREWESAVHMLGEHLDEHESKLNAAEYSTFCELAESVGIARDRFSYLQAEQR